jgi:osmoprotectant transport system ATP-binding protein
MIDLRAVVKQQGDDFRLGPLNLHLPAGRITALIGASGSGKSTVLKLVTGLVQADRGEVIVDGTTVGPDTCLELRRRLGYSIQGGGLFPHLTAAENVTLLARHLGRRDGLAARLAELSELTHLTAEQLARYPAELSGGEQQRVSLMRALFLEPRVLLLDEPLGALDPLVRASLQNDLLGIFTRLRTTVVLVTHDLAEARHLAEHIVLMRAGQVVQEGDFNALRDTPANAYVAEFFAAQRGLD